MKRNTTRLILDCMICDAMSPEFKTANDILIRIIKLNDRTDGIPYPRLVEINKAFKSNDAKAAKAAYDKLAAFIPKGEKTLKDELEESKSKLAETTKAIDVAKKNLADGKAFSALFDKFVKAIDTVKANPKALPKLKPYADKLKPYGDFAKRIDITIQMDKAGKDIAKQCDMLKKAVSDGKAKYAKTFKGLSDEFDKAKNRLAVYKEAVKIRTSKVADFVKEKDEVKKLGGELPSDKTKEQSNHGIVVESDKAWQERKKKIEQEINQRIAEFKNKRQSAVSLVSGMKPEIEKFRRGVDDILKKNGINSPDNDFWISQEVENLHRKLADAIHADVKEVFDMLPRLDSHFMYNSIPEKLYKEPSAFLNGFKREIQKVCNNRIRQLQAELERELERGPRKTFFL